MAFQGELLSMLLSQLKAEADYISQSAKGSSRRRNWRLSPSQKLVGLSSFGLRHCLSSLSAIWDPEILSLRLCVAEAWTHGLAAEI